MEKINIGKTHLAAIILWAGAVFYEFFGTNNFDLLLSLQLLIMACIVWFIFISNNLRKMQKPLHMTGYQSLLIALSLILMLATYYILLVRHELMGAIVTSWIANATIAIAATLTYFEVKRSSN